MKKVLTKNKEELDIYNEVGLVYVGKNEDGEKEYCGEEKKWKKIEKYNNYIY